MIQNNNYPILGVIHIFSNVKVHFKTVDNIEDLRKLY